MSKNTEFDPEVIQQMSVLLFNQQPIQEAFTKVTRAVRLREGITMAGLGLVQQITLTALKFTSDPSALAQSIAMQPTSIEEARTQPGMYQVTNVCDGDVIRWNGEERIVEEAFSGRGAVLLFCTDGRHLRIQSDDLVEIVRARDDLR